MFFCESRREAGWVRGSQLRSFNEMNARSIDLPASENARFMRAGFFVDNDGWFATRSGP